MIFAIVFVSLVVLFVYVLAAVVSYDTGRENAGGKRSMWSPFGWMDYWENRGEMSVNRED